MNLDLDDPNSDEGTGGGAPSSSFGGAASNPGYWNAVFAGGPGNPVSLRGLDDLLDGVTIRATGFYGSYGGFRFEGNTGDYARLLNDYADVGGLDNVVQYHFTGLLPGRYQVYTYAVNASGRRQVARVYIPGADDPLQFVTGPMPGNRFILGITHSIHDITLAGNSFEIDLGGDLNAECNGFQIVAVPEPSSFLLLAMGGIALSFRSKRFRSLRSLDE